MIQRSERLMNSTVMLKSSSNQNQYCMSLLCCIFMDRFQTSIFVFSQVLQELQGICPQRCWERTRTASQWTFGHVVSLVSVCLYAAVLWNYTLHAFCLGFIYSTLYRLYVFLCVRCDPVHLVGGLPSLLGRGPTQTVPTNQGWGIWRKYLSLIRRFRTKQF